MFLFYIGEKLFISFEVFLKVVFIAVILTGINAVISADLHPPVVNLALVFLAEKGAPAFKMNVPLFSVDVNGDIPVGNLPEEVGKILSRFRRVNLHGNVEATPCRDAFLALIDGLLFSSRLHRYKLSS